ncbi:MAG: SGNH/GDSL hydrolase family protein [Xenococcaceae cyanobacterium]
MFKSRPRERLIFAKRKPKRYGRFSSLWLIISISLFLLVIELLTRIFIDISGSKSELQQTLVEPEVISAYQLDLLNQDRRSELNLAERDSLLARRSLSVGYELAGGQKSDYWEINERGFRDSDPLPLAKPAGEIRIFLLGNSTAFGYGNSSNEVTISEQLEARLAQRIAQQKSSPNLYQPDVLPYDEDNVKKALAKYPKLKSGNYRVINAGVPGYASGNELAQVALSVLPYKPDLIIILDGYTDLMLASEEKATEIPQLEQLLEDRPTGFRQYLSQLIQPLRNYSHVVRIVQDYALVPNSDENEDTWLFAQQLDTLAQNLPEDEAELERRVQRYFQHHKQIVSLSAGAHIPLILANQPEFTGRDASQLSEAEGEIATQLGRDYIQTVKNTYPQFIAANQKLGKIFPYNVKAISLYNLTDKYPTPSFIDAVHLTDEANKVVAQQLYYAISSLPKMKQVPRNPPPKPKPQPQPKSTTKPTVKPES